MWRVDFLTQVRAGEHRSRLEAFGVLQDAVQAVMDAVEKALEVGLPPVLLTPLYWLEKDLPDFCNTFIAIANQA
jgi:hypothetical protein